MISPALYEKVDGAKVEENLRSFSMKCRSTDRKLGQVEEMLRAYLPFIYEHAYVFRTDRLKQATEALSDEERKLFAFDIEDVCWRHYWVDVQVPGLDKWSLPLLRGERVPEDAPMEETSSQTATADCEATDAMSETSSAATPKPQEDQLRATA